MVLIILFALLAALVGAAIFLVQQSTAGEAPGLIDGALAPCPASPNCVSSEAGTPASHAITPLPGGAWARLPDVIGTQGGNIVVIREDYLAAEFATPLMGFVDDVEFRNASDVVHVRSASRVGRSDFGANKKRVEALRAALEG